MCQPFAPPFCSPLNFPNEGGGLKRALGGIERVNLKIFDLNEIYRMLRIL